LDSLTIATVIATYLVDRDDVATAEVFDGEGNPEITVTTQGGETYYVTIARAS
jgi:hypothetical protein